MNPFIQTLSAAYLSFALGIVITTTGVLETYLTTPVVASTSIAISVILAIAGKINEMI